jgi:hypothetical protein
MIYQLNNVTHWELSPALMGELVSIINCELAMDAEQPPDTKLSDRMVIELCNLRSTLECELQRLQPAPYDGSDLI